MAVCKLCGREYPNTYGANYCPRCDDELYQLSQEMLDNDEEE